MDTIAWNAGYIDANLDAITGAKNLTIFRNDHIYQWFNDAESYAVSYYPALINRIAAIKSAIFRED